MADPTTQEIAASVASELFPAESPGGDAPPPVQGTASDPASFSPPPVAQTPASPMAPAARPLPKAWKKEMEQLWGKLPPEAHDYIYDREADVSRGIQSYRDGHERWNQLTSPFQEVLAKYPDVNPVELLSNLMRSHLALSFSPQEQKAQLIRHLLSSYNIDPQALLNAPAPQQPDVQSLVAQQVQQAVRPIYEQSYQREVQEQLKRVEAFFADPKNEHAKELEDDILKLVQGGERDLQQAYEKAMWLNPAVRAKLIAKQAAPSPADALNVRSADKPNFPAPRKGSIDDTIDGVIAKHYSTH